MNFKLSGDIIHTDRAWHDLEARIAKDEAEMTGEPVTRFTDIVDLDVLPERGTPYEFADRGQVRDKYESFLADPRLEDAPSKEFIRRRVVAELFHLDMLEGSKSDIFRHVETAMNADLILVDEETLDQRQQALEEQLRPHGLGFDRAYAEAFQEKLGLEPGEEPMKHFLAAYARRTGALAVHERPEDSLAVPKIVEVDAGWVGYFGTDNEGKPYTLLNAHHRHGYTRARAAAIAAHEAGGHAVDFEHKQRAIMRGDMDPLFGVVAPFAPEIVTAETIALGREQQSLRSVRGEDAWEYHFQADYHDYAEMVWNNALFYINTGREVANVAGYLQSRLLPCEKRENMEGRLRTMREDPAWKAIYSAYEPGMRIVRPVLELPVDKQDAFFKEIGTYPYSEAQMHQLLAGEPVTA